MQVRWNVIMLVTLIFSVLSWFAVAAAVCANINVSFDWDTYWTFQTLIESGAFWLSVLGLVTIVYVKDAAVCVYERTFNYRPTHIIAEVSHKLINININL